MKHRYPNRQTKLFISIFLNFLIAAVQIIGGILANSLSLLSDALHNFSDAFALIVSFIAIQLSKKGNTEERTFGYKRAEVLAAFLNASILIIISFYLFKEAIFRFSQPYPINSKLMIFVATVGLAANIICVLLLKKDARESLNLKAAYLHLFSDVLSSFAVICGGISIYFFKTNWIDPLLSLLIGAYVLKEGYDIVSEALHILMQNTPRGLNLKKIQSEIEEIEGVENIHHLHVWAVTERDIYLEAHIDVAFDMKISESCILKTKIEKVLKEKFFIDHPTLQFEYKACERIPLVGP